ncbi:MAG: efflux RND transporter permease subunit [Spirochaetales bacterium]|nr:efflux RND transporter permease subunit [Spirochaetales bacterium]
MNLTEQVVKRPVAVVVLFALFIGMAAFLVPQIPVALFPTMEMPNVMVITTYDGAGPEEVEQSVTEVIESKLSGVSDLESITSTSSEETSMVTLAFDYSKDLDEASDDIDELLDQVIDFLPDDCDTPIIFKMNSDSKPVMSLAVQGDLPQNEQRSLAEDTISPLLERVSGVASVSVSGGQEEIVRVDVSENRLEAYNLTLSTVSSVLDDQNYQLGSGTIMDGEREYLVRTDEEFADLDEIRNVIITKLNVTDDDSGQVIRLKDVAEVNYAFDEEDDRVYINGHSGVTLSVTKESDANTIEVSDTIHENLASINAELPRDVELLILDDDSTAIRASLEQTYNSLYVGMALAMLVLFFFLRSWASTIIIGFSIPISIFITILCMYFMDLSINLMTLTGIILGLGMVVDCSIVILENIFRYRERGTKLIPSAVLGAREMITSISASTMTTICVFIPIILFSDNLEMLGQIFVPLSLTIIIALAVSLVVAVTLVPTLSAHYIKLNTRAQKPLKIAFLRRADDFLEEGFERLDRAYKRALGVILDHKIKVLILAFLVLFIALQQFASLGIIFTPNMSEDSLTVSLELPQGTTLDETEQVMGQLAQLIEEELHGIDNTIITIGEGSLFGTTYSNKGSIELILPSYNDQTMSVNEMKTILRNHFNDFPGATLEFTSRGPGMGNDDPVDIMISSDDNEAVIRTSAEIRQLIEDNLPGVTEPTTDADDSIPQVEVKIDRDRAYALNLDMYTIATEIGKSVNGTVGTTFRIGGDEIDVKVILQEEDRSSKVDLNKIFVINSQNERIALSNVATLVKSESPVSIYREEEKRVIHVTGGLADGYSSTQIQAQLETLLSEEYVFEEGVDYSLSGDFEDISSMGTQMALIGIIAMILVFGVMAAQFESLKDPFIIFLTIPFMMIGVVLLYTVSGYTFSMMSAVGLVVLVGLVVNSSIVLVDYTNLLIQRGYSLRDACIEAGGNRLKPILMTTCTTILGMLPLAFFGGDGTEQVQPIAQTIVGGLLSSGIMTLFVTPVLYFLFNRKLEKAPVTGDREDRKKKEKKVC